MKVENKLGHWCNKWLSIGGRYTLIKATLEGQSVYWMVLASIPIPVQDKLQKLTYNFLWTGMHHCNWETLAKPKLQGGWGIRNIFTFNTTLDANSLWWVLTTKGIWSLVIKDKYLPHTTVETSLRSSPTLYRTASTDLEEPFKICTLDQKMDMLETWLRPLH
jgi:hypothetical protein